MVKHVALAGLLVLTLATATAQERPETAGQVAADAALDEKGGGIGMRGDGSSALGWTWYTPRRTWSYHNGTAQRLWMDFTNTSGWIEVAHNSQQAPHLDLSAAVYNWLGVYWTSSTTWSSSQLWYY